MVGGMCVTVWEAGGVGLSLGRSISTNSCWMHTWQAQRTGHIWDSWPCVKCKRWAKQHLRLGTTKPALWHMGSKNVLMWVRVDRYSLVRVHDKIERSRSHIANNHFAIRVTRYVATEAFHTETWTCHSPPRCRVAPAHLLKATLILNIHEWNPF